MNKIHENKNGSSLWFVVVDILIILLLAGFIASLFLIEKTGGGDDADPEVERLTFAVAVEEIYDESLFLQEGNGAPIPLRFNEGEDVFGWLSYGQDGQFYVECARSAVRESQDLDGLWYLGDTMLLNGTVLSIQSTLADFSVTIISLPQLALPGTVGTTEDSCEEEIDSFPADEADKNVTGDGEREEPPVNDDVTVGQAGTDEASPSVTEPTS